MCARERVCVLTVYTLGYIAFVYRGIYGVPVMSEFDPRTRSSCSRPLRIIVFVIGVLDA